MSLVWPLAWMANNCLFILAIAIARRPAGELKGPLSARMSNLRAGNMGSAANAAKSNFSFCALKGADRNVPAMLNQGPAETLARNSGSHLGARWTRPHRRRADHCPPPFKRVLAIRSKKTGSDWPHFRRRHEEVSAGAAECAGCQALRSPLTSPSGTGGRRTRAWRCFKARGPNCVCGPRAPEPLLISGHGEGSDAGPSKQAPRNIARLRSKRLPAYI